MGISKENLVDLQEKYERVRKLIKEDSKLDPESEPYKSKYNGRELLLEMDMNAENLIRSCQNTDENWEKLIGMQCIIQLSLGRIGIDTEELSTGELHLNKCFDLIKPFEQNCSFASIFLSLHNQLGILWSKRDPEKSLTYLEKAESFYKSFKDSQQDPIEINEFFVPNIESHNVALAREKFEKLHTLSLYYLAQMHGTLNHSLKSSIYFHITLKRQLVSKSYEPIDWALNTATLSQFFMERNGFKQARHHLAASSYMLDLYEKELNEITENNEENDAKKEVYKHRSADVARCWIKYGLLLLASSRERLLNHSDDLEENCTQKTDLSLQNLHLDEKNTKITEEMLRDLQFTTIDLSKYESCITDQFILVLQDAKKVFLDIQKWVLKAQDYYTLQNLASDFIEIQMDYAQSYESLLFFDENPDNQSKYYKRSADLMEFVIKEVNPTYYMNYCRNIWYKLAQVYMEIMDIKNEKLRESQDRPNPHVLNKINSLIDKSILNYTKFVDSFKNNANLTVAVSSLTASEDDSQIPKSVTDDNLKLYILAYFHIAALNSRFISCDKHVQLQRNELSYRNYKRIDVFSRKDANVAKLIPLELGIVKEMVTLLPLKIEKLRRNLEE